MSLSPTELGTISAIGAAVVPPVVSFLKRQHWTAQTKQAIAFAVSAVVAVVGIAITGASWAPTQLASLIGLVFLGGQAVYGAYFRGSAVDSKLTSVGSRKTTTFVSTKNAA
jgi:hypothetical protein